MNFIKACAAIIILASGINNASAQRIASDKTTKEGVRTIATNAIPVYNGKLISVAASVMIKGNDTAYFIGFYKKQLDLGRGLKNDPSQNTCTITLADGSTIKGEYVEIIAVEGNDIFSYHFSSSDFKKLAMQDAVNVSLLSPVAENFDFKILNRFQGNIKGVTEKVLEKLR